MTEMYCDLQSRGVKRKFVEDSDESCDRSQHLPPTSAATPDQPSVGPKVANSSPTKENIGSIITTRILEHSLNLSAQQCYVRQRQQIFNISICKLNRFRQSSDPSLLRSVLVCNGLKALERELSREGIKINFGPHGVSFTPPVSNTHNMTLDPPPSALNALVNNNNNSLVNNNSLNNDPIRANQSEPTKRLRSDSEEEIPRLSSESSSFAELDDPSDEANDNPNGEYEKYLLDLYPSSGRVTPFHKTIASPQSAEYDSDSSMDSSFTSTPLSSQSANSAFWGSDDASDRLTQLNWSSVFNTSSTTTSSGNKSIQSSAVQDTGLSRSEESAANKSSNSSSFTTLLPPSAATSPSTTTTTTCASNGTSSTTATTTLLSPNSISLQNIANSQSMSHLSVISTNSITFSTNGSNDEIFGDIDLSLYDFDLLTPLSPPNVKLAPITAEELIRNISSSDCNSCVSSITCSSSSSITISTSSLSLPLSSSQTSSSLSANGSPVVYTSSNNNGYHHQRYFKSSDKLFSEDRDQQAITPVMS